VQAARNSNKKEVGLWEMLLYTCVSIEMKDFLIFCSSKVQNRLKTLERLSESILCKAFQT
jgi:hypothetical protein